MCKTSSSNSNNTAKSILSSYSPSEVLVCCISSPIGRTQFDGYAYLSSGLACGVAGLSAAVSFSDHQAHTDADVDPSNPAHLAAASVPRFTKRTSSPLLRTPPLHHEAARRPLLPAIQHRSALPCADAV
ncbi:hypothetical protein M0R45_024779 [Rubus argutus]|uniref:Uncharacterized protein n=1 Tax=Rubus argutus TaxID=59490 RepID=A0AAW1WTP2_RUBAR